MFGIKYRRAKYSNLPENFYMKKLKWVLMLLVVFIFAGCYEVNEDIVINKDGSGTYNTKMDMGQLIEMIQSFAGEEELKKQGMDRAIDTMILMKSVMDSAKNLTPQQKELMKDGKMRLQMNLKEKLFKIDMNLAFKNYVQLQDLMSGMGGNATGLSEAFKGVFGNSKETEEKNPGADIAKDPEMDQFSKVFDITVKDGFISKKVNADKLKALMDKPEMAQVKDLASSGMEILYTTTIKLPRPVKKVDHPSATLSEDKKTVTIKYNMLDMFQNPEKFSFSIEY